MCSVIHKFGLDGMYIEFDECTQGQIIIADGSTETMQKIQACVNVSWISTISIEIKVQVPGTQLIQ